jgi:hypothetical protein
VSIEERMNKKVLVSEENRDLIASYWIGPAKKKKNNPTKAFEKYCKDEPWQLECREYDT